MSNMPFEEIPLALRESGEEYAIALSAYEFLDDMTKTQKARLMNDGIGTESARERYAYSHPDYKKHLESVKKARHDALKLKSYIDSLNALFDLYRSRSAMARAEM
jgi:hypothetical protein